MPRYEAEKGPEFSGPFCVSVKRFTRTETACRQTLHAMTAQSTPTAESSPPNRPDDLYTLTLLDGLAAKLGDKEIRYQIVKLRETGVADERKAEREAERCVQVNGSWRLVVSDSTFKHVLNMLHIESMSCDEMTLSGHLIDLDLYDRLSSRDLSRIEERIFLLSLAAEVRYGNMTQTEFEAICDGLAPATSPQTPQPSGQASDVGAAAHQFESGPAMLTDFTGKRPNGPAEGDGHPNRQAGR